MVCPGKATPLKGVGVHKHLLHAFCRLAMTAAGCDHLAGRCTVGSWGLALLWRPVGPGTESCVFVPPHIH